MKKLLMLVAAIFCFATLSAQAKKDVICIYNFSYSSSVGSNYAEMLRNTIIEGLNETGRLTIIDANNDDVLKAEMARRSQENA